MTSDRMASSLPVRRVADDVGVALAESGVLRRIEPGIHE